MNQSIKHTIHQSINQNTNQPTTNQWTDQRPERAHAPHARHGQGDYDVCVIGAGCIGSAIARELSKYQVKTALLEADDDVTQGATKGNSGVIHAGYDDEPGE